MSALVDRCPHCDRWIEQRTLKQSAAFAIMTEWLAENQLWCGQRMQGWEWRQLFILAFERVQGRGGRAVVGLDEERIDMLVRRPDRLPKQDFSELLEYVYAWCVLHDITLPERPAKKKALTHVHATDRS